MRLGAVAGVLAAVALHAAFLAFGGLLLPEATEGHASLQQVELLEADAEKPPEPDPEPAEPPLEQTPDAPPEAPALDESEPLPAGPPALDAASLAAISDALLGGAGGGDFAAAIGLASGGRIGGTGRAGGDLDGALGAAFSLAELDQKPRLVFQADPLYPAELRQKKLEVVVTVAFVVDATGKTAGARVEKSDHPAFERPALDAVRQWKFEPAVKGGKRVPCRMRIPIRFKPPSAVS